MSDFPWFPMYVTDILGDDKVIVQDLTEFGAYVRLLCLAWQQKPPATIPSDDAVIAKLLGVPISVWTDKIKPAVIPCWQLRGNRYVNPRLKKEYDAMIERRSNRQRAGSLGGKQRSSNARAPLKHPGSGTGDGSDPPDGETEGKKPKPPWTPEEWQAAVTSLQCLPKDAAECWAFYDTQGWVKITQNGTKVPITGDPRSLLTTWLSNPRKTENTTGKRHHASDRTGIDRNAGTLNAGRESAKAATGQSSIVRGGRQPCLP